MTGLRCYLLAYLLWTIAALCLIVMCALAQSESLQPRDLPWLAGSFACAFAGLYLRVKGDGRESREI